jgi:predicted hydrolase (HD superfamily)
VEHVRWARYLARRLLAEQLPRRWAHTQGVGRKAEFIAHIVGDDATILICAAWLHDIGYAPELTDTSFHPLDGARYLRDVQKADDRICRLVAHHSYAMIEARNRGLAAALDNEFAAVAGLVPEALTYCDMTTSPEGKPVDVDTRINDIFARYDENDVVAMSVREAQSEIRRSTRLVSSIVTR